MNVALELRFLIDQKDIIPFLQAGRLDNLDPLAVDGTSRAVKQFLIRFDFDNTHSLSGSKHNAIDGVFPDLVFSHGDTLLIVQDRHA